MSYRDKLEQRISVDAIRQSYEGVSFSPVQRAESTMAEGAAWLDEWLPMLADDEEREQVLDRFAKLFAARQYARGRTMSPMITGPANFPVHRNNKAMEAERKRTTELLDFMSKVESRIAKRAAPASGVISSDDPDAIAKLQDKLARINGEWESAKRWNAQFRKGGIDALDCGEKLKANIADMLKRCPWIKQPFDLTRYSAEAKRIKDRIIVLERQSQAESKEVEVGEVKIVADPEANRVRIYFPGKPEADKRTELKRAGFRWAPSEGAWQRFYSAAAMDAARRIAA